MDTAAMPAPGVATAGGVAALLLSVALTPAACGGRSALEASLDEEGHAGAGAFGGSADAGGARAPGGAGGAGGDVGEPCLDLARGEVRRLAEGVFSFELALTADAIFATDLEGGRVLRIARCDGAVDVLAADQTINPRFPVFADGRVHWALQHTAGSVWRVPAGGGDPEIFLPDVGQVQDMAADETDLYVADLAEQLLRVDLEGGEPESLPIPTDARLFEVDAEAIYLADATELWRLIKPGPNANLLFWSTGESLSGIAQLTLGVDHVYWLQQSPGPSGGILRRVPKVGGEMEELASGLSAPARLAVAATGVFHAAEDGDILRVDEEGGQPSWAATSPDPPRGLVADEQALYWTTAHGELHALGL